MGQGQSRTTSPREVSPEQLSHELALHFASKCYTHLEIAHFKDNFKRLADHQDGIEYWKEETLCRFLCLPDSLRAGSVLYQMCTYLGAFPFPSLAPCILTREAMLKVITIMSSRYKKVLKRGRQDKVKLLFRSLAVFDRRASMMSSSQEKPTMEALVAEQKPDSVLEEEDAGLRGMRSHVAGFSIDEPSNDDEEEDDDDLVLAALESLDAIEVFKHNPKVDRKIQHAYIPSDHMEALVMLLLATSALQPQENMATYSNLDADRLQTLRRAASSIIAAFEPDPVSKGIRYTSFVKLVSTSLPLLFEPLNPLFEQFLFSKNIDLSKHKGGHISNILPDSLPVSHIPQPMAEGETSILNDAVLAQIATFASSESTKSSHLPNFYERNTQFHPLYSTSSHGTSLSSFSRQVLSWSASTLLLVTGSLLNSNHPITIGTYLPNHWRDSGSTSESLESSMPRAVMFQLSPHHAVFPGNQYVKASQLSYFSNKTGIAIGCVIPPSSRTHAQSQLPILGPVSLLIDSDISTATFQHDGEAGTGAFLTDPILEEYQHRSKGSLILAQPRKIEFEIDAMEVWGITTADDSGGEELTKQKKRLAWEEAEAARSRGVNFGGDKDGARALLEMAGIVGDDAQNRSGGSI